MPPPKDIFIAQEKLTEYLLRWRPEDDKSAFLAQAGYTLENPDRLMADIHNQAMLIDSETSGQTEYGPK